MKNEIRVKSTSFEVNKLITTTQFFSNIKLTISARLVLRCIVDFWNFKLCCSYPTQKTIAKCTGLTEVAVGNAVKELDLKGIIEKKKIKKRIYYYFTLKFLGYLNLLPKIIYINTQKKLGNIPKESLDKNILKEKENTSFPNLLNEENIESEEILDEIEIARIFVKHLSNNRTFAGKIKELKEKYNL